MARQERKRSEFDFLVKLALKLGAEKAKVIPVGKIVVEDRVLLKCLVGCDTYKRKLMCPPYAPMVDQFRKMLKDYKYALLAKFPAQAEAEEEVGRSLLRHRYDPTASADMKDKASSFWSAWTKDKEKFHLALLELEKAAFNKGYVFALGFSTGSCALCEKCNIEAGVCVHPTMARYPEHAVGVNMKKTAEKAGMSIVFPFSGKPQALSLMLID
jgi:predicted metal-binding protein